MNQMAKHLCMRRLPMITSCPAMSFSFLTQPRRSFCKPSTCASQCVLHHLTSSKNPIKISSMKLSTSSYQCWKCGNFCLMEHKFCSTCNTIQPTRDELSYFEVLGVEPQFNINVDHLSNQFKNLQRLYHPDKFSGASEREQELSAQHSSRINKAYQTLSQPLPRAEYLLLLSEQVLTEADTDLDKRFLITVMDLNEELAEAETETQLAELKQRVQLTYDQLIRDAGEAFNTSAAAARPLVAQAKYYRSLLDKIRQQERERGIAD